MYVFAHILRLIKVMTFLILTCKFEIIGIPTTNFVDDQKKGHCESNSGSHFTV